MTDHERVTRLFLEACELPSSERTAFLDRACGDDAELRAEVEAMLAQDDHDDTSGALAARVLDATATQSASPSASESVGPYRLLQKVGEGGTGEVRMAEQMSAPVEK